MASADIYTAATQLAILLAGRTPVWTEQANAGSSTPPSTGIMGVPLQDAVRTLVHVSLREVAHARTARLTIPTPDLTCVYTVTIDGTAVAYDATADGAASLTDLLEGIRDAIDANGTVNQIVDASIEDGTTVVVRGIVERDWSIDFTESDAAVLACVADPCRADLQIWWLPDAREESEPPSVWAISDAARAIDRKGFIERFDTAGLARCFVQLSGRVGDSADGSMVTLRAPVLSIGPCLLEEE